MWNILELDASNVSFIRLTCTREFLLFCIWFVWLIAGTIYYSELGRSKGFYMAVNVGYSIGKNPQPVSVKFTGKATYD